MRVFWVFLFISCFAQAAPLPEQLWIQSTSKECLVFSPGDEHVSFQLKLPDNSLWKRYDIVPFKDVVNTDFGTCQVEGPLIDCCERLGLRAVRDAQDRGWIVSHEVPDSLRTGAAPTPSMKPVMVPAGENTPRTRVPFLISILSAFVFAIGLVLGIRRLKKIQRRSKLWLLPLGVLFLLSVGAGFLKGLIFGQSTIANHDGLAPLIFGLVWGFGGAVVGAAWAGLIALAVLSTSSLPAGIGGLILGCLPLLFLWNQSQSEKREVRVKMETEQARNVVATSVRRAQYPAETMGKKGEFPTFVEVTLQPDGDLQMINHFRETLLVKLRVGEPGFSCPLKVIVGPGDTPSYTPTSTFIEPEKVAHFSLSGCQGSPVISEVRAQIEAAGFSLFSVKE